MLAGTAIPTKKVVSKLIPWNNPTNEYTMPVSLVGRGLMVRATNESTPWGYKEVAASENATYPPRLVWTYDRAPAAPDLASFVASPTSSFSGFSAGSSGAWSL